MRLIDADALIESVCHTADLGGWIGDTLRNIKRLAVRYINSAPTIDLTDRLDEAYACGYTDAEAKFYNPVVHGEWIYDANGYDYGLPAWKCNQCGCINANIPPRIMTKESKPNYAPVNPNAFSGSNFCPNCGAKMGTACTHVEEVSDE